MVKRNLWMVVHPEDNHDAEMAIVIAEVGGERRTWSSAHKMSSDLPADALGEHLALAIQKAWKAGCDPVDMTIVVSFS